MKQNWENQNLDEILRGNAGVFARSVALDYLGRFARNIDPASTAMSIICSTIESTSNFIGSPRSDFPAKRVRYLQRVKNYNDLVKEANRQQQEAAARLKALGQKKEQADAPSSATLAEAAHAELEAVKAVGKLKNRAPKRYQPYYSLRFKNTENGQGAKGYWPQALPQDVEKLLSFFDREARQKNKVVANPVYANLQRLSDMFAWPQLAKDLILCLWTIHQYDDLKRVLMTDLIKEAPDRAVAFNQIMAVIMGVERKEISGLLSPDSELFASGILVPDKGDSVMPKFTDGLLKLLGEPDMTPEKLLTSMIGESADTPLSLKDNFNYVAENTAHIAMLVKKAVKDRIPGQNIIIYGLQDSGKTEFTKALAKELGLKVYMLAESESGKELSSQERMARVLIAKRLTSHMDNVVLAVDEAEDLLKLRTNDSKDSKGVTKVYLNRMLERGFMTIWIVNDIDGIDPAVRRRFKFAVHFGALTPRDRLAAWKDIAKTKGLVVPAAELKALADQYEIPVGSIVTAVENAVMTTRDVAAIKRSLRSTGNFVFDGMPEIMAQGVSNAQYFPRLANFKERRTGHDPETFTDFIAGNLDKPIPIYAYGPVGSGKKSLFRDLAHSKGWEFLSFNFRQILNPVYLQEVMRQASGKPSIIAWDSMAVLNNVTSQQELAKVVTSKIDELLQILPGVHLFCSNTRDKPPEWLAHQFPIVLEYDYMKPDQIRAAWGNFFGQAAPRKSGASSLLTPGYFATIAKRYRHLNVNGTRLDSELGEISTSIQQQIQLETHSFDPMTLKN